MRVLPRNLPSPRDLLQPRYYAHLRRDRVSRGLVMKSEITLLRFTTEPIRDLVALATRARHDPRGVLRRPDRGDHHAGHTEAPAWSTWLPGYHCQQPGNAGDDSAGPGSHEPTAALVVLTA
jgi:hypothetical protein